MSKDIDQPSVPPVALVRCRAYGPGINRSIRKLLDQAELTEALKGPPSRVLLKPNLIHAADPQRATTTHPALVDALVRLLQAARHSVIIADSYSGAFRWTVKRLEKVYQTTGMTEVARRTGCDLNYDLSWHVRHLSNGSLLNRVELLDVVSNVDWILNVPKLKTHAYTGLTCAVKNLFGLVPGHYKVGYHARFSHEIQFSQALKDIALSLPVRATIVDGIVAMEGNGPAAGPPVNLGVLFGGGDLLAVDCVAAQLCGITPRSIPWLEGRDAAVRGLSVEDIIPGGMKRPTTSVPGMGVFSNPLVRFVAKPVLKHLYTPAPVIDPGACIQCFDCARGCPNNAITTASGMPTIDRKRCIRCYCCSEACEQRAMTIPESRVARWLA